MKKLATLIMVGCMTLAISFGFAACKDKACNHKYDNACDAVCNLCEEERAITHKPNADDNDCTTAVTCQNCSTVLTAAKTHDFETAQWQKDVDGHWHVCNNEDCNQTDIKAEHISDGAATETKPEKCTACGYEIAPMLEHTHAYGEATYEWNADYTICTATRVCSKDITHVEAENGVIASEITKQANCAEQGETTYTATFTNTVFEQQVKTVTDTSAEHTYETAVVEWNADYSDCTVTRLCTVCNHTDSLTKTVKNESDGAKTVTACDENGREIGVWVYKEKSTGGGYYLYQREYQPTPTSHISVQTFDENGNLLSDMFRLVFEGYAPDSDDSEFGD